MSIVENLKGIVIVDNLGSAIACVELAPWDEYGSALEGNEIWGSRGEFASRYAGSNFTYESAIRACNEYFVV